MEEALSIRSTALTNDCILRISKVLNNGEDYEACMNHVLEELTWGTESVGVVFVDVNGLKKINDTQGNAAGDEALRLVARQLSTEYGAGNVYREGGVLLPARPPVAPCRASDSGAPSEARLSRR